MPTSKHLQDPGFMAQVDLLRVGATTRDEICAHLGIDRSELSRRFRRCGLIDELKKTKRTFAPDKAKFKATAEADALYAPAVAYALAHPCVSATEVFWMHKGTTYMTLIRRIKKAQKAAQTGQDVARAVDVSAQPAGAPDQQRC